jgi:hypothetical protein
MEWEVWIVSGKVRSVFVSRGATFTDEEMEEMEDQEGWVYRYVSIPPR